ncbi:hypothetical protein BGZ79_000310, partial [Entomortierella chlamydospora]
MNGSTENQFHHPPNGDSSDGRKKPKTKGNPLDPSQVVEGVGATTPITIGKTGTTAPSSQQLKPTGAYNSKIGIIGMQNLDHMHSPNNEMEDEQMEYEWIDVQRNRDRYLAATVPQDLIYGDTKEKRKEELRRLLVTHKIHCTEGPSDAKSATGEKIFRVAVESQKDLDVLLSLTVEDSNEEERTSLFYKIFTRLDNARQTSEMERSIEIYGLHPRTEEFKIQSAMAKFGDIQKITTRPCSRGVKIIAKVTFGDAEDVTKFKDTGKKWVFIGRDLARVSTIG